MKDLLELVPLLIGYPIWFRAIMLSLPPLYVLCVILLNIYGPTPSVTVETFRRFVSNSQVIAMDVTVRNPTSSVVAISGAELELYGGEKPEGGLLSATKTSARYSISKHDKTTEVDTGDTDLPLQVDVTRPYTGSTYERLRVPLAQEIEAGKIDRFTITLAKAGLVSPEHDTCEIKLLYDAGKTTAPVRLKLD